MRRFGLICVLAAGCGTSPDAFDHQSELDVRTRGVALAPGGELGQAGMLGTTCAFDTRYASIAEDYDFPSDDEVVVDAGLLEDEVGILVISPDAVHVSRPQRGWGQSSWDIPGSGAVDARVLHDGVVGAYADDGCEVRWYGVDGSATGVDVNAALCGGSMDADPTTGSAFLAGGDVARVDRDGTTDVFADVDADLVRYDPVTDAVYVAAGGDDSILALELDGSVRWAADLDGGVRALEDMGTHGAVAVMVELESGLGRLVVLDGWTGELRAELSTPGAAEALVVDDSGAAMGLVLQSSVHLFKIGSL